MDYRINVFFCKAPAACQIHHRMFRTGGAARCKLHISSCMLRKLALTCIPVTCNLQQLRTGFCRRIYVFTSHREYGTMRYKLKIS
jgi:hypothetical protein